MARVEAATKVCTRCGREKSLSAYHRNPQARDGRYPACAECRNRVRREERRAAGAKPRPAADFDLARPYANDAWFAGFADGEGCFILGEHGGRFGGVVPEFILGVRSDDAPALVELHRTFGGRLYWKEPERPEHGAQVRWCVGRKSELLRLMAYFDRFRLRAKKAKDYAIWRRAVEIYVERGRQDPELRVLQQELREARVYDPAVGRHLRVVV